MVAWAEFFLQRLLGLLQGTLFVTFGTVWRFMIETVAFKKQVATAKPLVKGYNFFKSKHVLGMYHLSKNGKHFIRSQVLPSMKISAVYTCYIAVSSFSFLLRAKCGFPAGIDGRCNHFCCNSVYSGGPS